MFKAVSIVYKLILIGLIFSALYQVFYGNHIFVKGAIVFFTIQYNIFVMICLILFLFMPLKSRKKAVLRGIALLGITVTGIVYCFVLHPVFDNWGTHYFAYNRTVTHIISPIGFFLDWLIFDRHGEMKWKDLFCWLAYPVIYYFISIYVSFRYGASIYFFVNSANGLSSLWQWTAILLAGLLLISCLYIALDKALRIRA